MEKSKFKTLRHIETVRNYINLCIKELLGRGEKHDQSKLESPEVEIFDKFTSKLAKCTYGSDKYRSFLAEMKPALEHHYASNKHHPEYQFAKEEWKDINGYKQIYQISSLGRVKSLDRKSKRQVTGDLFNKGQFLKLTLTPKGYHRVQLQKDGKYKHFLVHVLVAKAFIRNRDPNKKTQINHINGIKEDNNVNNLEWVSQSENLIHAYETGLKVAPIKYVIKCNELDIISYGCEKMEKLLRDAGYKKANAAAIWACINGKRESHLDLTFDSTEFKKINKSEIMDMTLVDLLEMLCDWKASSMRHQDGNILKSIEINQTRFGYTDELKKILENTALWLDSHTVSHKE